MDKMPDAIAVRTHDGDVEVHYASPHVSVLVDDSSVVAFNPDCTLAWVDTYEEGGPQYREFGEATFYRVIREYVNRRRNTDKRLGLIGG